MRILDLEILGLDGGRIRATLEIDQILLAGYTGRDPASVRKHIAELEALGVARPPRIPMIFEIPSEKLTTAHRIIADPVTSSGEVEYVLVSHRDRVLVGVGSDHTDRDLEARDLTASKRACPKVVCGEAWRLDEVEDHWDQLILRSWVTRDNEQQLYQQAMLATLMRAEDLTEELVRQGYADLKHRIVFGGTVPTLGGYVYGWRFDFELFDPVTNRSIGGGYDVFAPRATTRSSAMPVETPDAIPAPPKVDESAVRPAGSDHAARE